MLKNNFLLYILLSSFFFLMACGDTATETTNNDDDTDTVVDNGDDHETDDDYTIDSSGVVVVTFNNTSISGNADGVSVDGTVVTITAGGTYRFSGTLDDGQIFVDSNDTSAVKLILDDVNIYCSDNAPIYIYDAEKAIIILADGSDNYVKDNSSYGDEEDANAAIYCKSDLTMYGNGTLTVDANYNDGITGKDGFIIASGTYKITSVDDGIRGKDYLIIKDGTFDIDVEGDGLKSDNDEDSAYGYISIQGGTFDITADVDGIQAETDVVIYDGDFSIKTGGGSTAYISDSESAKGLKGGVSVVLYDGSYSISSADDAIHSDSKIQIDDGTYLIASGDDGIHSDESIEINGGTINITKSYEGIESTVITINDGDIHLKSSDDGLNVAGGNDGSGHGSYSGSDDYYLYMNGGYVYINATGDGIDVNGNIVMKGGTVLVNGPTSSGNGALDYDRSFKMNGGILIAAGSSRMAQTVSSSSSQNTVKVTYRSTQSAGRIAHLQKNDGTEIFTFAPVKNYQSLVFSLPTLESGSTYNLYYGGSSTGTNTDGFYEDGSYTAGTQYSSFKISSTLTSIN